MITLTSIFNNRELAILIWSVILMLVFLPRKKVWLSVVSMIKSFFQKNILLVFSLMVLYISFQVVFFYEIELWDLYLIKSTVYWTLGVASVSLVNVNEANKDSSYFKKLILKNIKFIIILEFIINLYTFSLWVEMIVIPIVAFHVMAAAFSENKKEYSAANKVANIILGIFGFVVLVYSIVSITNDFQNFWMPNNLRAFILPPLLLITFIPFLYSVALYMTYELLFRRLDIFLERDKNVANYAKKKIFALCHLNLWKLNRFIREGAYKLYRYNEIKDIQEIIKDFNAR